MFDMGFEPQIKMIMQNVRPDRQTVLFSATFPKQIEKVCAVHRWRFYYHYYFMYYYYYYYIAMYVRYKVKYTTVLLQPTTTYNLPPLKTT